MNRILVTGATGNVGKAVIHYLHKSEVENTVFAGVRNVEEAKRHFAEYPNLSYAEFDFAKAETFPSVLQKIDRVFLLRPPNLADVQKYFEPLLQAMKKAQVQDVVFLSVQGAERSSVIPHHKIEKLIREYELDYIFLRPSYFMQNLTTTLLDDIQRKRQIILPAGKANFNWLDVQNIGEVAATMLLHFGEYKNAAYEITGYENENFHTVAELISQVVDDTVEYRSVNPLHFLYLKWRAGIPFGKILVMLALHFLPRFQADPDISDVYEKITGKKPTDLKTFVEREKAAFRKK